MMEPTLMDEIFASAPPFSSEDEEEACRVRPVRRASSLQVGGNAATRNAAVVDPE
jgi:hypothetical protein